MSQKLNESNIIPPIRISKRERKKLIYLPNGVVCDEFKWTKLLATKIFKDFNPICLKGHELTYEYLQENLFETPIFVAEPDGLDMEMPNITVPEVAELVGTDRVVDVLEVSTQTDRKMTMGEWSNYFRLPEEQRERILNVSIGKNLPFKVISLEIGESALGKMIIRPKIVRDLDWIDNIWPRSIRVHEYPRVQLYCLMGVKNSYTDFHIDFGGTSVFYHIISGSKIFYFIKPTKRNLEIYSAWTSTAGQGDIFLGDLIPDCSRIRLEAGNTLFIPSGWIHAVFTPVDTVVIGGNFLHTFSIENQLQIAQMEIDTNVPMRFRFPYFANMQWYAAKKYLAILKDIGQHLSDSELQALQILVDHLSKLASCSTNFSKMTKIERKTIRSEIPPGLKNVTLLLQSLQLALACRRNGKRMNDEEDGWESDLTEMEFVDSEDEIYLFLPEDVPLLTDEEDGDVLSDDAPFEDEEDIDDLMLESGAPKPKRKKKISKKKLRKKIKSRQVSTPSSLENKKITISFGNLTNPTINVKVLDHVAPGDTIVKVAVPPPVPVIPKIEPLKAKSLPTLNGKPMVLPKSTVAVPKVKPKGTAVAGKKISIFDRLKKNMKKR